ncbi:GNAT family N-acetyltransferase [Streptomyces lonarensis]|uniref:GNAT family N-acetyltransferase n=1 Tax=Streptomyces lonarensis TaxID=700599 RepID=A0A7X6D001_9ACTN|nr:GNAT family N-acetyltransferase [Streptomyces lonarensis]NJQ05543.1 GNAT family N-acetyltransferase [Streptomyces lonarensis]
MLIREATDRDWSAIWPFFHRIVAAGDTFCYDTGTTEQQGRALWMLPPPARVTVAVDDGGAVLGSAKMYPNQGGNGAHVASASYMVDPGAGGRGAGRALVEESLSWARGAGYRAMQYNAVVETNVHAVRLYRTLGFSVVGTVPEAFLHPAEGYVGLHVMRAPLAPAGGDASG